MTRSSLVSRIESLTENESLPNGVRLKTHRDGVLADLEALPLPQDRHDLGQGKFDRAVRAHLSRRKRLVTHRELEGVKRNRLLVDLDFVDPGDDRVAESVFEAEDHAIGCVLQTSVRIELLQDERRDLHASPPRLIAFERRKARALYPTRTNRGSSPNKDRG